MHVLLLGPRLRLIILGYMQDSESSASIDCSNQNGLTQFKTADKGTLKN